MKRVSRKYIIDLLKKNKKWNILDLGSGSDGFKVAGTYADIKDHTEIYEERGKKFVQTDACNTPFKDKEFDFVIAAHLAEHVEDPVSLFKELMRIGKKGYIEVPTPFFDNITWGNQKDSVAHSGIMMDVESPHLWWVTYKDVDDKIIYRPKVSIIREFIDGSVYKYLFPFFEESMTTGLYWEASFEYKKGESVYNWDAGNSDSLMTIDLTNKQIPPEKRASLYKDYNSQAAFGIATQTIANIKSHYDEIEKAHNYMVKVLVDASKAIVKTSQANDAVAKNILKEEKNG